MLRIWGTITAVLIGTVGIGIAYSDPLPQNEWSRVLVPTSGSVDVFGFYSHGCLAGASALPQYGVGYQVMRPFRNRFYGHPETIQFIEALGKTMDQLGSGILVGDMGQPRGGPLPYGHTSHQVGLDVDVWFWTHPEQRARQLTDDERNNLPFVTMLNSNGVVDPKVFKTEQIEKLKNASLDPHVQRIFVNPAIKTYLCSSLPEKDLAWLHKLRPWPGHEEHFHVRLYCPAGMKNCTPQDPVPAGDGCQEVIPPRANGLAPFVPSALDEHEEEHLDDVFAWFETEDALPKECTTVLKAPALNLN